MESLTSDRHLAEKRTLSHLRIHNHATTTSVRDFLATLVVQLRRWLVLLVTDDDLLEASAPELEVGKGRSIGVLKSL
ncbi:uncharacterized protein G2W53_002452 [Senna tora]|uniref:Uncharacterized protein n=1 Tax=Senna tora TaxID=362788 RepID=A0A834XI35_9FABA|nr:uncharacterized protein G2W53_002452 [Senna tora]